MPSPNYVELSSGGELENVDLTLRATPYSVAGRVLSQSRLPLPDASISLLHYGYTDEALMRGDTGAITVLGKLRSVRTASLFV